MPAIEKTQTTEEINNQNKSQEERANSLLDSLKTSSYMGDLEEKPEEEVEGQEETEVLEGEVEENTQEEETEEIEEELIPKSKVQARIDKLVNENKLLRESQKVVTQKTDDVSSELENMSDTELKSLKRQVRSAQLKSGSDEVALNKLLDLEEKIDSTIQSAPSKFANKQLAAYNQAAEEIANDDSFGDMTTASSKILEIAKEIYSSEPELQRTIQGQAIALKLAAKHFKAVNNLNKSSSENKVLKSQVNTLKKRTSLDSKVMKGSLEKGQLESLRTQALKGGTSRDKINFIQNDPRFKIKEMLPDFKIG